MEPNYAIVYCVAEDIKTNAEIHWYRLQAENLRSMTPTAESMESFVFAQVPSKCLLSIHKNANLLDDVKDTSVTDSAVDHQERAKTSI